jgi:hypothetical protein
VLIEFQATLYRNSFCPGMPLSTSCSNSAVPFVINLSLIPATEAVELIGVITMREPEIRFICWLSWSKILKERVLVIGCPEAIEVRVMMGLELFEGLIEVA